MIRRIWHAYTSQQKADEFETLMLGVVRDYEARDVRGFLGAQLLRRTVGDEVEFILSIDFDNDDALKLIFADSRRIRVPDGAMELLIRSDQFARDYQIAGQKEQMAAVDLVAEVPSQLKTGMWFVRDKGHGPTPVTREGHRLVLKFLLGMVAWGVIAFLLALLGSAQGISWALLAWPVVFVIGAACIGWIFIQTAKKHTDTSITYRDYVKSREPVGGAT